jgi:hypothetical protein
MSFLRALSVSFALALGACMQMGAPAEQSPPPAAQVVASPPSPRAECAPAHVTLYFSEQVASDEPVVTPLLNDFMTRIRACEAAGGELRAVTIATSADPGQSGSDARAQIERRQQRVSAALVDLGVPAAKITGATAQSGAVMGRRADITADLY